MNGYSDRINHASAFAAKYHDQRVRQGERLPYLTKPANVAVILARYGFDEGVIVAGALHDVIQDALLHGNGPLEGERLAVKFGTSTVEMVRSVTTRRSDDDGVELSIEERKVDQLRRIATAGAEARCVSAACALHSCASLVSDLSRTIDKEAVMRRYRAGQTAWYRGLLLTLPDDGPGKAMADELGASVAELEALLSESGRQSS